MRDRGNAHEWIARSRRDFRMRMLRELALLLVAACLFLGLVVFPLVDMVR